MKMPVYFISHGGGPWPWIPEMKKHFEKTSRFLTDLGKRLHPKGILSISGHWEEPFFTVGTSLRPPMEYDYHGFPPHTYQIQYPAPGSPELVDRVMALLAPGVEKIERDPGRGLDHGTFVPLHLMWPEAHIPVVPLSLRSNLDPAEHFKLGELLQPLREEGILILASGLSYHNLRAFFSGGGPASERFESWLTNAVESDPVSRKHLLLHWEEAPEARMSHPREDHLIPLMVAAGAAGTDKGERVLLDDAFQVKMASYQFG